MLLIVHGWGRGGGEEVEYGTLSPPPFSYMEELTMR
jgi:hypothetical protein